MLSYYFDRYIWTLKSDWLIEANSRALNVLWSCISGRILSLMESGKIVENPRKILVLESTNRWNWRWIWDWIFRTAVIWDLANSWISVDVATYWLRSEIFENNPDTNNIYRFDWTRYNFLKQATRLKQNWYDGILSFYPDTYKSILSYIIWFQIPRITEEKDLTYMMSTNHIEMYREIAQKYIQWIVPTIWNTRIVLTEEEKNWANKVLNKTKNKIYIWIHVWGNSSLRTFKKWVRIIDNLNSVFHDKIVFVLYWINNIWILNKEMTDKHNNIIDLTWKTVSLRELFAIINELDFNVWVDWWPINASIALWKITIPIYNVVRWINRVPGSFDRELIIQWWCSVWFCWEKPRWSDYCSITNQWYSNHEETPPCLESEDLTEKISEKCLWIIEQLL